MKQVPACACKGDAEAKPSSAIHAPPVVDVTADKRAFDSYQHRTERETRALDKQNMGRKRARAYCCPSERRHQTSVCVPLDE